MAERIRLLATISDLRGGGAERELSILLRHLSRQRFDLHLCLWRPVFTYKYPDDVPCTVLNKTRPWHVFRTIRRMAHLIDKLTPDLIFSQLHYVNMVTGSALALSQHQPAWICRQVNDPRREMSWPFVLWARLALRRADVALGCCEGVTRAMGDYLRLDSGRLSTMTNAVDIERIQQLASERLPFDRKPGVFIVVHAARFCRQKNQTLLLEAFSSLRGRAAELWMLGEGPLFGALRKQAHQLGVASQVKWLGFQSNPYPFYREADCLALTSNHEGLPNCIIEAMACGTAAVSTRCPYGPEELIEDGVTGFLTPVAHTRPLAEAFVRLADDRRLAARLGAAARAQAVVRFQTSKVCAAYEDLFKRVVESQPCGSVLS
jgi:glycosyltransferase involved in cell wall biosynthesis